MIKPFKVYSLVLFLAAVTTSLFGQCVGNCTTLTATLTDGSGQVWSNGVVNFTLIPPFNNPAPLLNNGVPVASLTYTTITNNSGLFTQSLDTNTFLTPANSKWKLTLCPNATVKVCSEGSIVLSSTGSIDLSATISAFLTTPSVLAAPVIQRAYQDSQANGGAGSVYWNTTNNTFKGCAVGPCPANSWQTVGNLGVPGLVNQIPFNNGSGAFNASSNLIFNAGTNVFNARNITGSTINNVCTVDGVINVTLANAVTCAGSNGVIILGNQLVPTLVAPVTVPSGVVLKFEGGNACVITTGGFALTINGPIIAPPEKIFCGTGVTGLSMVMPEWFGSTTISTTVQSAFAASGGTMFLQPINYQSAFSASCWTQPFVWFKGFAAPYVNGGTTALTGGTVIQGSFNLAGTSGAHFSDLGMDNGSAVNAGPSTGDALSISGVTGCTISNPADPLPTGVIVERVVALLSSGAVAFHGIRLEHLYAPIIVNSTVYYGTHGITLKSPNAIALGNKTFGQGTDGIIVKGDTYTNVKNVIVGNSVLQTLNSSNVLGAGLFLQCGGPNPLSGVKVFGLTVLNSPVGIEMLSDAFCSVGAGSQDAISINDFTYKIDDNSLGLTSGFGFFSQTLASTATNVHLSNFTINNALGNTLAAFEAFSLSMPMNNCTFENFHVSGVVGGGSQIAGGPLYINNYTEFTTFAVRPFVLLASANVTVKNYSGTNTLTASGKAGGAILNIDSPNGNGLGFLTTDGYFQNSTITINSASATNIGLPDGQVQILLVRDNTNGGSALIFNDANGGPVITSSSGTTVFVTGAPAATQIQVTNVAGQLALKGGASRNNVVVSFVQIG